jgi:molybdate transport system ATP-binding protein
VAAVADLTLDIQATRPVPIRAAFSCAAGGIHAVVGPSGCGKSTLLRLLAGLLRPQAGQMSLGDRVWFDASRSIHLPPQVRRIGYVSQFHGLFPHLTALGNVMAGLMDVPAERRAHQALQWLERVGLSGLDARRPSALSGGQRQRVALARALARSPGALLLDEPFASVDRVTRESLYAELVELRERLQIPIVLVTHDLQEATMLSQQMSLMADGEILQTGEPQALLARPSDERAAAMLGQQNIFDGVWRAGRLCVGSHALEVGRPPSHGQPADGPVRWMIPSNGVRLRAMFKQALPDAPNRIGLRVVSMVPLGQEVLLTGLVEGLSAPLRLRLTARLCEELRLEPGRQTEVLLRSEDIHIFEGILNK